MDVKLQVLIGDRYLIQSHPVHLDGLEVLLLLEVYVSDVGLEPTRQLKGLVLADRVVHVESLRVASRVRILTGQVE